MDRNLKDILLDLIKSKREGVYWDFKEYYDDNKASLLHDILCLSNAQHKGDRFLIYGVSDPPVCNVRGVNNDSNRKKQHEFIDFIRAQNFAGDIRPEIELKTEVVDGLEIDVLIIFDHPEKPYYVLKNLSHDKKTVMANSIYKRTGDSNTPIDKSADISAIALMWRERFGLDVPPLEKARLYLLDYENWEWDGIDFAYYKYFPEFTVKIGASSERGKKAVWWDMWPAGEPLSESIYEIKYHTTQLAKRQVIHCRREDFSFPYPDVSYITTDNSQYADAENTYSIYSYTKESLDYSLLQHLLRGNCETGIRSYTKPAIRNLPFIIFQNDDERKAFTSNLKENLDEFFSAHIGFPRRHLGIEMFEEEKAFAEWAYAKYRSWS